MNEAEGLLHQNPSFQGTVKLEESQILKYSQRYVIKMGHVVWVALFLVLGCREGFPDEFMLALQAGGSRASDKRGACSSRARLEGKAPGWLRD